MKSIKYLFFIVTLYPLILSGQDTSVAVNENIVLSPTPAIVRSILLPGWGQIYQERLTNAALFSFSSISLYIRSAYFLDQYNKYSLQKDKQEMLTSLSSAVFIHLMNIVDVTDAAFHEKPTGWHGELLGDTPLKSPWGAVLRSAIIPGWGQVYDESYFKAALALGANGYFIYKARNAHRKYLDTKDRQYSSERSKYNWWFGIAYILTMADAYAGAYLYKFEESMELTVLPQVEPTYAGIQLYVVF